MLRDVWEKFSCSNPFKDARFFDRDISKRMHYMQMRYREQQ